ncbi:bifunctional nicotinamidase/pyrazinamidase [Adhaeribacter rhizoryzae]|uniref:Nicotinamidase n=1 Tax=Adhaeribacter rhizoryzae TaxID=2607907 RepID=A0A5M6DGG6_9BACT|nr:bifunctional nicotinamidase/pyrazinamidase [Adhaeribacter rhizoryzae]KAA5546654.1 bifunctional nicotinamidase/pyrazinamidase [Adhaeribacter rhizoryzae]
MRALLLIDIQNDFIPGGALAVPEGDLVVPLANQLQPLFDVVVATQDWHPPHHKSFASNHAGKTVFEKIDLNGLEQVLWPDHCVHGTAGANFFEVLNLNKVEAIFRKGTDSEIDSYSGFFDNGHRKTTALADYLRGKQVSQVYIMGLAGDYCVYYTAKDALALEFQTFLIEDGIKSINPDEFEKAKSDILNLGGQVIHSQSLL